jgi:3-hydroxyacyl-[acyl-carrier-protein] dehydratase
VKKNEHTIQNREYLMAEDTMDIQEVMRLLPHRYPFLLIDRVISCDPGKELVALKNVTMNEPYFNGHFPNYAVMPGVLIVEAMAQASALLAFKTFDITRTENNVFYFVGIDDARFKKPVTPGDQLTIKAQILRNIRGIWKFSGQAYVDEKLVSEATLMCTMRNV